MPEVQQPESVASWHGALSSYERGLPMTSARAAVKSYEDGTRATLMLTNDRKVYWVKVLGNPQGNQILVTEAVVSGVGTLINAPVRPTALVAIPPQITGVGYGGGYRFRDGIAHGSLHLENAEERDTIEHQRNDGNQDRRGPLAALWDWCLGADPQWLYDMGNDYSIWSFDHGFWLGGDGGDWTTAMLTRLVDTPWQWTEAISTVHPSSLEECALRLRSVSSVDILRVLATVPRDWGTDDRTLETLGWFLFCRRLRVADRLDATAANLRRSAERSRR
jgi:hypothetical protein